MQDHEPISHCLLCDGNLSQFLHLGKTPLANEFSEYQDYIQDDLFDLILMKCINCNHIQLNTIVDPNRLFRDYLYVSGTSKINIKHFNDYAENIFNKFNLKSKNILDIGSNDGTFLKHLCSLGANVIGIDPALNIAKQATQNGISTIPEFFNLDTVEKYSKKSFPMSDGSFYPPFNEIFSCVCANHIFAHTKDLSEIIKGVLKILADDGVFIFENSYLGDMLDKCLIGTIYHEHIHMHHLSPLIKFFRKFGMKVFDVERLPEQQGGSFRVFVCKNSANRKVEQSVFKMLEEEKQISEKLSQFKNKIENWIKEIYELLNKYKSEEKIIDIFGYPAKLTTELYTLGVEKNTFRYAYEDAELKVGRYSPGLHIPVLHPSKILENNPSVLFIGAWNFAKSIIKNHRKFVDELGGTFLVPLPELKEINKNNINEYLKE